MTEKEILDLISAFGASGLAEMDYAAGDSRLSLSKYPRAAREAQAAPAVHVAPAAPLPPSPPPSAAAHPAPAAPAASANGHAVLPSPIVATFYRSPGPDVPPFVEQGKKVKAGQTLCILEAMKVMNEFTAEFDMEIVRVLPENGKMVEYGQPLFEVRRV